MGGCDPCGQIILLQGGLKLAISMSPMEPNRPSTSSNSSATGSVAGGCGSVPAAATCPGGINYRACPRQDSFSSYYPETHPHASLFPHPMHFSSDLESPGFFPADLAGCLAPGLGLPRAVTAPAPAISTLVLWSKPDSHCSRKVTADCRVVSPSL